MRFIFILSLITFCNANFLSSQERYDSLQNIKKENLNLMVGQTLVYPPMERIKSNLFWKNKRGKIYESVGGYNKFYSKNEAVRGNHFKVKKAIKSNYTILLECVIVESGINVFINSDALFETQYPYMYVECYLSKLNKEIIEDSLFVYFDKLSHSEKLFCARIPNTPFGYFKRKRIVALNPDGKGLRFFFQDGKLTFDIESYKKSKVQKEIVCVAIKKERERAELERIKKEDKQRKLDLQKNF